MRYCNTQLKQTIGLMFTLKKERAFFPCAPVVHTWFCFRDIELRWLDKRKKLIKKEIAKPFALKLFHPPKNAKYLEERII